MRIALCQLNSTVADFQGNTSKIAASIGRATALGADLAVFPELAICGYPPLDLLDRPSFLEKEQAALKALLNSKELGPGHCAALVGCIRANPDVNGRRLHNSAALLRDSSVESFHDKVLLPTYDVFDEDRYFEPGEKQRLFELSGHKVGVAICEDLWNLANEVDEQALFSRRYRRDPCLELVNLGAELIICPSASPFQRGKIQSRERLFQLQAKRLGIPIVLVNTVGANTELIFDGSSACYWPDGEIRRAKSFEEDFLLIDLESCRQSDLLIPGLGSPSECSANEAAYVSDEAEDFADALVLGIRDYFAKCGFKKALIGLSGGIDSAVVAALAVEALGPDAVRGVLMPSPYSSAGSVTDALQLAKNMGIRAEQIEIGGIFQSFLDSLKASFEENCAGSSQDFGLAEENIQARARGALLMALSNKFGEIVLTTGNKSEMAVGYCTIYGDMCGGLAVLGDLPKMAVYAVSKLPRYQSWIPIETIEKPPSAELRPGQMDADSLPEYSILDDILCRFIELGQSERQIVDSGHDSELVGRILRLVEQNEYKRRQAAPVLKVTPKAFGLGRRYPIARKF